MLLLTLARSTYHETNSVHFRESLIWSNLFSYIKSSRSVCEFKDGIRISEILIAVAWYAEHEYASVTLHIHF